MYPLKKRLNDYLGTLRHQNGNLNYANYSLDENHRSNDDFETFVNKGSKLNALESLEINRRKFDNVLLNNQYDINNSPLLDA